MSKKISAAAVRLGDALQLADYAALRAYKGSRKIVFVRGSIGGAFARRADVVGAVDDGGVRIVGQYVWDRLYDGGVNVQWFGAKGDGQTDDWAAIMAADAAANVAGKRVYFPAGRYLSSKTLIAKAIWQGENTENIWAADVRGTIIETLGAGNPSRWTDIDGNDLPNFTPLVVVGRSDGGLFDMTLKCGATAWSAGIVLPSVRRVQVRNVDTPGLWTASGIYLDATWSRFNTTLKALHPEIESDDALNEIVIEGGFFQGAGPGIKIQGTTRDPASITAENWQWAPGGASDVVFRDSRCTGLWIDAACPNAAGAVQGIRLYNVNTRVGSREHMIYIDRGNRVEFYSGYGETSPGNTAKVSFTSRTGDVAFFGGRYISNTIWFNGGDTGIGLGSGDPAIPILHQYTYDGRIYLGSGTISDVGGLRPSVDNSGSIGTSTRNWATVRARRVRSDVGAVQVQGATSVELLANNTTPKFTVGDGTTTSHQPLSIAVPASVNPSANGQLMFELTNNTSLKFKVRGSDGVVRSATLILS